MTANLGVALKTVGNAVTVIDLDPQNALGLYFGLQLGDVDGGMRQVASGCSCLEVVRHSAAGVDYLPYGLLQESDRSVLELELEAHADCLQRQIASLAMAQNSLVLIDTPPGASVYMQQALVCADLVIVVVQADAGSYASIPQMQSLLAYYASGRLSFPKVVYLVNQMDGAKVLNRDVLDMLRQRLGDSLIPYTIHRDQAVSEALAFQQSVLHYATYSQATHDIGQIAEWVQVHLQKIPTMPDVLARQSSGFQVENVHPVQAVAALTAPAGLTESANVANAAYPAQSSQPIPELS